MTLTAAQERTHKNAVITTARQAIYIAVCGKYGNGLALSNFAELVTKGTTPKTYGFEFVNVGVPFLRSEDVTDGEVSYKNTPFCIDSQTNAFMKRSQTHGGDILITIAGSIGRAAVVPTFAPQLNMNQAVALIRLGKSIDSYYVCHMLQSHAVQAQISGSTVTSIISNLSLGKIKQLIIPLPPLVEQKAIAQFLDAILTQAEWRNYLQNLPDYLKHLPRLVARIEELAAKIDKARGLSQKAIKETSSLMSQAISEALSDEKWRYERLEKVLAEPPRNGLGPQKEVENGGRIMLRINAVSSSPTRFVDLTAFKMVEVSKETAKPFTLKNEDVFIVRYNGDINRVAKAAIFKSAEDCDIIYPDKLMRLRLDRNKMLPDFLVYALGCRSVRSQVEDLGKTTAGQIGVSGANAKSFQVPIPPLDEQRRLVVYFDNLQEKVSALKNLQAKTAAEIDALLPSILDRAFKGML